jgi:hypothetical protein
MSIFKTDALSRSAIFPENRIKKHHRAESKQRNKQAQKTPSSYTKN